MSQFCSQVALIAICQKPTRPTHQESIEAIGVFFVFSTQTTSSGLTQVPFVLGVDPIERTYPATEAQIEVWLSSGQSDDANCAYNEMASIRLSGEVNREQLKLAIQQVVARHAALRSTFSEDGLTVRIHKQPRFDFHWLDWTGQWNDDAELEKLHSDLVKDQARKPFDLEQGPLLRVVGQSCSPTSHRVTLSAHHAVLDGWSLAILIRDLGLCFDTIRGIDSSAPLPPCDCYETYSRTMAEYGQSDQGKSDEAYWTNQFLDSIPVLDLPIASSRPSLRTYVAGRHDHSFSIELMDRVRKVGARSGCSLFNTLLAAFQAYVSRISGNDDFCIGIPTAGQSAMEMRELIGHCVNTLPVRTNVDPSLSFRQYLVQSRGELLDAMDHQRYSYGQLLRKLAPPRDASRPPMLSVSFNLDPAIARNAIGFEGLSPSVAIEKREFENFEWFVNGVILEDKSVELQVQYNADLFTPQMMEFYFEGFEAFVNEITNTPDKAISAFPLMSVAQRQRVIVDWNETTLDYPQAQTLHGEFARQAHSTPDRIAVEFGETQLSYSKLDQRSNQVARFLNQRHIGPGELVGICVDRSERMLVYLLGILKTGAAYVPLDPSYPVDRLQYMCEHSNLKAILAESNVDDVVQQLGKPSILIDRFESEIETQDIASVQSKGDPSDPCYVIYTSGSTGKPKGVVVPHGPVVNFLYSMQETPGFTTDDVVLAVTTLSFDIAVLELYLPVVAGGKVVIADQATATDGSRLSDALDQFSVSLLQATPATWRMLIQSGWQGNPRLKVLCGGEPMPSDLVAPLLERCGELWNMYGPTETTVWSAAFRITDAKAPIFIGKPIGNTQIYLLDPNGNEVPPGCEGEVFIGGAGVTHGYLNQADLTSERFVDHPYFNPFKDYVNHRIYRTGDLAKYCFDGNLQFLRRNDKQVKVRGFRIELGEIEKNLDSHPDVRQNVVVVREDVVGDARIVAYLVANDTKVDIASLRGHLRNAVPYYMVPQHFVVLDQMPQTNNGKIDYKALPAPKTTATPTESGEAETPTDRPQGIANPRPLSWAESLLLDIWNQVLEVDDVGISDNFFEVGGHSLLVVKVIAKVKERTGVRLSPQDFLIGTLEQIAYKLDATSVANSDSTTDSNLPSNTKPEIAASHPDVETQTESQSTMKTDELSNRGLTNTIKRSLKNFWN